MAKKADLLAEAKKHNLKVSESNTIAEIEAALKDSKGGSTHGTTRKIHKDENQTTGQREEVSSDSQASEKSATNTEEKPTAKAGKRSAKALAEAEQKLAKEQRKAQVADAEATDSEKPKHVQKTRTKLERAGKKLRAAAQQVEAGKEYSTKQALELAIKTSTVNFDATVELHVRLNVDPKHADQNIRENIVLPAGTGRAVRVAVFGEPEDAAAGKKAGADISGSDEFLQQLDKGIINFDVLIAIPAVMAKLGKYARVLGPKGLMPNPKSGTVTKDVAKAVEQAKAGKVELRVDETGIVHLGIGKVSFGSDKLYENAQAVFAALKGAKPSSIKGTYVVSIYATSSMGPSIKIAANEL